MLKISRTKLLKQSLISLKTTVAVILLCLIIQACSSNNDFDIKKAKTRVSLSESDLKVFSELKAQLIHDFPAIKKQNDSTNNRNVFKSEWVSANTYYLNKIDSVRYHAILSKLKCVWVDDFQITSSGKVLFLLKQSVKMGDADYNTSYDHELISLNCIVH